MAGGCFGCCIGRIETDTMKGRFRIKKKLISLALVLALTLALMLPTFAAVTQPVQTHACNHHWIALQYENYRYVSYGAEYHQYQADMPYICDLCAARKTEVEVFKTEKHYYPTGGNSCVYCGHTR